MSISSNGARSALALLTSLAAGYAPIAHAAGSPFGLEVLAAPAQPNTVVLGDPAAPDKEIWSLDDGRMSVRNVTRPTLTAFRPVGVPASAAVIIAPGGAFLGLEMEKEGWDAARWFANHGVTAFVLKYRTLATPPDQAVFVRELEKMIHGQPAMFAPAEQTPPQAVADGVAALRYVRRHAGDYGVDPKKIGFMGFSAGGFLTVILIAQGGADRPDFAGPIYPNMSAITVPADAPPMFVAVARDDFLLKRHKGLPLVDSYLDAGKSVELHLYSAGGHGFATGPVGSPEHGWMDLMLAWMRTIGMTPGQAGR